MRIELRAPKNSETKFIILPPISDNIVQLRNSCSEVNSWESTLLYENFLVMMSSTFSVYTPTENWERIELMWLIKFWQCVLKSFILQIKRVSFRIFRTEATAFDGTTRILIRNINLFLNETAHPTIEKCFSHWTLANSAQNAPHIISKIPISQAQFFLGFIDGKNPIQWCKNNLWWIRSEYSSQMWAKMAHDLDTVQNWRFFLSEIIMPIKFSSWLFVKIAQL